MALRRIRDRETITLDNLSFAAGEVTLIKPTSVPHDIHMELRRRDPIDLDDYLIYCLADGILSPEDYGFLVEMSSDETVEFYRAIMGVAPPSTQATDHLDFNLDTGLSESEEAEVAKFSDFLRGLTSASEPTYDDGEEGEGLAAV